MSAKFILESDSVQDRMPDDDTTDIGYTIDSLVEALHNLQIATQRVN